MTVEENCALLFGASFRSDREEIRDLVDFKLSLVGLAGFGHRYLLS